MNAPPEPIPQESSLPLADSIATACQRIPPLWPLKNFVAVNPFVGLRDRHFLQAAQLMQQVGHGDMLMPAEFYREQIAGGRIREQDFQVAVKIAAETLPAAWAHPINYASFNAFKNTLASSKPEAAAARVLTFADFQDAQTGRTWAAFVVEEISKWCSAYYDLGQSSWRMPWRKLGLFAAWKAAAQLDLNPELTGMARFRELVAALPDDHREVIARTLRTLDVPEKSQADFLHRQLMSVPGWSSYVQYLVREKSMAGQTDDSLAELLAIRVAYDLTLHHHFGADVTTAARWRNQVASLESGDRRVCPDQLARYVAQQAWECAQQSELMARLRNQTVAPAASGQKTLQAIFCIDVRSEVFRRALEAQSKEIETIGFAGFFGMAIEYQKFGQVGGDARCPVLLTPKIKVREALLDSNIGQESRLLRRKRFWQAIKEAWNSFKASAISCFAFVETAGLWFGVKLAQDSLGLAAPERAYAAGGGRGQLGPKIGHETCRTGLPGPNSETGIVLADQIALAAGALKNMGLVAHFAKVILICGHGSATANNPYASALDCGACGGHAGDANARVAAAILNQPRVRDGLKEQGIQIPAETIFIAGLHNTTTDEVLLYDAGNLSAAQAAELEQIKDWLAAASRRARRERAVSLGLAGGHGVELDQEIFQRSRDWSQVRPEWGLAGNFAFIAAPRALTKGLDLEGRIFLHNYEPSRDPERATLELILIAPVVVASWINLQYYASTVNNRLFGSGNKVLHNVVGTFGVWQGNGGDLQPGLPLQSVHDGAGWRHEPLRLNVFIAAECEAIASIIAKQAVLRELVENGWINLFAMDASGKLFWRYVGKQLVEAND